MGREARRQCLADISECLESFVVALTCSDRPNYGSSLTFDHIGLLPRHLKNALPSQRTALLIRMRGGDTHAVWPIVAMIREMSGRFHTVVSLYAHSAGTLLALGGTRIVMTASATLSAVDPAVHNAFNPKLETGHAAPIAVEDVWSFLRFGAEENIPRERVIESLLSSIHPLALANVFRQSKYSRALLARLLDSDDGTEDSKNDAIEMLLSGFHSHGHCFGIGDARALGLPVDAASDIAVELEALLSTYDDEVTDEMGTLTHIDPSVILDYQHSAELIEAARVGSTTAVIPRAFIETHLTNDTLITEMRDVSHEQGQSRLAASDRWIRHD